MKTTVYLIFFLIAGMIIACSDSALDSSEAEVIEAGENFTFIKSAERAGQAGENRSSQISDPFEINDVRIETSGDTKLMHIDVTQEMGCEQAIPEKFEVIWDGIMLMIYPPQVAFYLTFNSGVCAELQENVKETIVLDLYEHIGDYGESAQYTVVNASKFVEDNDIQVNQ